jgi:hypothetical protein
LGVFEVVWEKLLFIFDIFPQQIENRQKGGKGDSDQIEHDFDQFLPVFTLKPPYCHLEFFGGS